MERYLPQKAANKDAITVWLIPILMSSLLGVLSYMAVSLKEISSTLAVAVSRVDGLDVRVTRLENRP